MIIYIYTHSYLDLDCFSRPSNGPGRAFLAPRLVIMSDAPPAEATAPQKVSGPQAGHGGEGSGYSLVICKTPGS